MAQTQFTYALDVTWHGAVVTFDGTTPIYNESGQTGLWVIVEYPPTITVTITPTVTLMLPTAAVTATFPSATITEISPTAMPPTVTLLTAMLLTVTPPTVMSLSATRPSVMCRLPTITATRLTPISRNLWPTSS